MSELKKQLTNALLIVLTLAVVVLAGINFQQQGKFRLPVDGVTWVDRPDGVQALRVMPGGPAEKAGILRNDLLLKIQGRPVNHSLEVPSILAELGAWTQREYRVRRSSVELKVNLIIGERTPGREVYYLYAVGAAYLFIGLFVYFRRGSAERALHFYILCLVSFVFCTFHHTGKLNNFDLGVYWGNVAAGVFAPAILFHFCLGFPSPARWLRGTTRTILLYVPSALVLGAYMALASGVVRFDAPLVEVQWFLDRVWLGFLTALYLVGGLVLAFRSRYVDDPIRRQQLKWLRNGLLLGVTPFAVFYTLPYLAGAVPDPTLLLSVFALGLVPLTWAYAILRYRLMDVDIIFQQGYVYTLTTLLVLGVVFGLVMVLGKFDELSPVAVLLLVLIAAFVFQPIRAWLQEQLDRYVFYKDRYDYRRTLVEFARELSSETDLDKMLASVADRLTHTLSIAHVAFFLVEENGNRFVLRREYGRRDRGTRELSHGADLDLAFLEPDGRRPYLFFESTRHPLDVVSRDWPASVRQTIARLDLTYYLPCRVRGRTIAYLGASRTDKGDFLSSDDVELLTTLAGYVGIAIENARLYRSLQSKVDEYERLKEYSENIVESINVGVVAVDLEDRVEGWNAQMERLTGISRELAAGRRLVELFPADLVVHFDNSRNDYGIQHLYKFPLRVDGLFPARQPESRSGTNGKGNGQGGGSDSHSTSEAQGPSRRELMLNLAITPLVTRDLERIGRLIIFDDVTERAELEKRLIQADRLSSVGLLAAGVAHEVNTPLAVISSYAQMLAKQVAGDEHKSRLLEKIARQTFRASEIVNSLLNFSRTSGSAFDELSVNQVVRETLLLIEHQLEKARVQVRIRLEEDLPAIRGNSGKLQQVFLNLFLNARDAMDSGGVLEIASRSRNGVVEVVVGDSGQGIPPEYLHRIYDPFFTTKSARRGTGLGLSVTYGIVKEHGGIIEVESQPGLGTRFHLEFPIARKTVNA